MYKSKNSTTAALLIAVLLISIIHLTITVSNVAAEAPTSDSFSIMQITDLQHLATLNPTLYSDTTSWIVNNAAAYNLKMVVYTGDFVDAFVTNPPPPPVVPYNATQLAQQWAVANDAMSKLLNAGIPYCWDAGNHDQTPFGNSSGTMMGATYPAFNATAMQSKPYWVSDIFNSKNTAVKFTHGSYPFLIINLEFMANSSALTWMKNLLDSNPSANVIVATHGYLNANAAYNSSSSATVAWNNAFKATLNGYPNVFLALSGHIHGWNMTRVGSRQEILFDRQEANNQTGAASVRIYTFNVTSRKVAASTYCIDTQTWLTDATNQFSFDASITSDWTLTTDARALKGYADLKETIWQKDARMLPNGQYDKIGLHRLVKTGITPKGVVFLTNCPMWGTGELRISNPATDDWTKYENFSQAIYWANRGFDVYAIDYRTHFVPKTFNASQASFAANWGLDVWVGDTKEAAEKVKQVSGSSKFFIAGECTGGMSALNYATRYWRTDLKGIILLDPNFYTVGYPVIGRLNETNTFNWTAAMNSMNTNLNWTYDPYASLKPRVAYALQNPSAPAEYPPGTPLTPATNPATNATWTNITEWATYVMSGLRIIGPSGNISQVEYTLPNTEFLPWRFAFDAIAMTNWVNCPNLTYDYNDHYNEIGVPVLTFESGVFSNRTGTLRFVNGINNTDFTGIMLPNYGHLDIYMGTFSARDVSQPALDWMNSHLASLDVTTFCSVKVLPGWTWYFFTHNKGGVAPHTYQWYEGLMPLQGQTSMVLPVTKNTPGIYSFYCRVTDRDGTTTTSNAVTLTVLG